MKEAIIFNSQIRAIIKQASDVIDFCCQLVGAVCDAPGEILTIRNGITDIRHNVQALESLVSTNQDVYDIQDFRDLIDKNGSLQKAIDLVGRLTELFDVKNTDVLNSDAQGKHNWAKVKSRLCSAFSKKPEARDLMDNLHVCRESIAITLAATTAKCVHQVQIGVGAIEQNQKKAQEVLSRNHDIVTSNHRTMMMKQDKIIDEQSKLMRSQNAINNSLSDQERREILRSFKTTVGANNIRRIHEDKIRQQEENTCCWMERENAWKAWLVGSKSPADSRKFIWVHGIAGAGKTILASYLIERAAEYCKSRGSLYYYCHHSRSHDESLPFLQHIVKHLAARGNYIPERMAECHRMNTDPSVDDLLLCLEQVSLGFEAGVRIIVDAVDESRPRDNLIKVLMTIGTQPRFWKISLLMTSRMENDIRAAVQKAQSSCTSISMSNMGAREDIRTAVQAGLSDKNWPEDFRKMVETKLINQSKGMFQWVTCQLDLLKRHAQRFANNEQRIREILDNLPKDIFATYERILLHISEDDRTFARAALALICSRGDDIPTAEILVESCLYNVPLGLVTNYNPEKLAAICGCLIKVTPLHKTPRSLFNRTDERTNFHKVSFAHYTVKEYLLHPDTLKGPASFFALTNDETHTIDLIVAFNGLRHIGPTGFRQSRPVRARVTRNEEYCLLKTDNALNLRKPDIMRDNELMELVLQSLGPNSPHAEHQKSMPRSIMKRHFPTWDSLVMLLETPPSSEVAKQVHILLNLMQLSWVNMAEHYLDKHMDIKTLSHETKEKLWTTTFKLRNEDRGGEENNETLLMYCVRKRQISFLKLFIRHGAFFESESEILYAIMYNAAEKEGHPTILTLLRIMLDAGNGARPDPVPLLPGGIKPPATDAYREAFAFTPLQVAVAHLEYDWVESLLDAGANANAVGAGGERGHVPYCYRRAPPPVTFGSSDLCEVGTHPPLRVCRETQPPWADSGEKEALVAARRGEIERVLKRWGAEEYVLEEQEGDSDTDMGDSDEMADLTRSSD